MEEQLLSQKEPELEDLEKFQPTHIRKHEKACSGDNTKIMARQSFDKEITGVIHGSIQLSQQKSGVEMR